MTFQKWMQEVNEICLGKYLMPIYDLPDMPFYDAYEEGQTPDEFIGEAIPDMDALTSIIFA